jgi:aminopeptidase N
MTAVASANQYGSAIQPNHVDASSYSNINEVQTVHLGLNFSVDFTRQTFDGQVSHYMHKEVGAERVILDTVGMEINHVLIATDKQAKNVQPANWTLHTNLNHNLGNALEVNLLAGTQEWFLLVVKYTTNNESTAINWLKPS